jgi:hypothetical protein
MAIIKETIGPRHVEFGVLIRYKHSCTCILYVKYWRRTAAVFNSISTEALRFLLACKLGILNSEQLN